MMGATSVAAGTIQAAYPKVLSPQTIFYSAAGFWPDNNARRNYNNVPNEFNDSFGVNAPTVVPPGYKTFYRLVNNGQLEPGGGFLHTCNLRIGSTYVPITVTSSVLDSGYVASALTGALSLGDGLAGVHDGHNYGWILLAYQFMRA
jgi:hypothetical protein